jgi:hypothetical protein
MSNTAKNPVDFDKGDDLSDIFGAAEAEGQAARAENRAVAPLKPMADLVPQLFEEKCPKCHGSGKFVSYAGRVVGVCRACNGTGKKTFRTSADHRAKAKASRVAREKNAKADNWDAFVKGSPDLAAWIVANPNFMFAVEMRQKVEKWGDLSPGQQIAIRRMIERDRVKTETRARNEAEAKVVDPSLLVAALEKARTALKKPMLRAAGFKFYWAGPASRWAGSLYVKGLDGKYFGRVTGGKFVKSFDCDAESEAKIIGVFADPAGAAIAYGRQTGTCACCGLTLTNGESIERGIGPICAEKFGF